MNPLRGLSAVIARWRLRRIAKRRIGEMLRRDTSAGGVVVVVVSPNGSSHEDTASLARLRGGVLGHHRQAGGDIRGAGGVLLHQR
jgi:hypothetical protein